MTVNAKRDVWIGSEEVRKLDVVGFGQGIGELNASAPWIKWRKLVVCDRRLHLSQKRVIVGRRHSCLFYHAALRDSNAFKTSVLDMIL
jgi:hypothetical protein